MEIVQGYPPNIAKIKEKFGEDIMSKPLVYAYGNKIYNPKVKELERHLEVHEEVHCEQQKELGPEAWWNKYLENDSFRLEQEIEAYNAQYKFIKLHTNNKISKIFLSYVAEDLASPIYGNIISKDKAETRIRKWNT